MEATSSDTSVLPLFILFDFHMANIPMKRHSALSKIKEMQNKVNKLQLYIHQIGKDLNV